MRKRPSLVSSFSLLPSTLDVLDRQARRQRLLQLVGLLEVLHAERVEVLAAAHLEFDNVLRLLDLDGLGVLPARRQQEVLDLADLLRPSNGMHGVHASARLSKMRQRVDGNAAAALGLRSRGAGHMSTGLDGAP